MRSAAVICSALVLGASLAATSMLRVQAAEFGTRDEAVAMVQRVQEKFKKDGPEATFRAIESDFSSVLDQIASDTGSPVERIFVPVSALAGDNIVHRSHSMPWYSGLQSTMY